MSSIKIDSDRATLRVYEIARVRGGGDGLAPYLLMGSQGRRARGGWIRGDQLMKVGDEERPPEETF